MSLYLFRYYVQKHIEESTSNQNKYVFARNNSHADHTTQSKTAETDHMNSLKFRKSDNPQSESGGSSVESRVVA